MSDKSRELLVVLQTGLFPDADALEAAVKRHSQGCRVSRHDLTQPTMDDAAWDRVLAEVLEARKVITI